MQKFRPPLIWAIFVIVLGLFLMLIGRNMLSDPSVTIRWEVGSQLDIQGFNIYRESAADTQWVRVNDYLIPGGDDVLSPQEFSYVDYPPNDQIEFQYIIEVVSTDGSTRRLESQIYRTSRNPSWIFWIGFIMLGVGLGWTLLQIKWEREVENR